MHFLQRQPLALGDRFHRKSSVFHATMSKFREDSFEGSRAESFLPAVGPQSSNVVLVNLVTGTGLDNIEHFDDPSNPGLIMITPDRICMSRAFDFVCTVLFQRIERYYGSVEVGILLRRKETLREFIDFLQHSTTLDADLRKHLAKEVLNLASRVRLGLLVDNADNSESASASADVLVSYFRHHLFVKLDSIEYVSFDKMVKEAVNSEIATEIGPRHGERKLATCFAEVNNRLGYI